MPIHSEAIFASVLALSSWEGLICVLLGYVFALTGGAAVGITDGSGNATGTVPGVIFQVGQIFSIGQEIFTVEVLGTPGTMETTGRPIPNPTLFGVGTFDTTTGAYTFTGAQALTQIYFYPSQPVMGFTTFELGPINNQPSYAFDTQFAYTFTGGAWTRSGTGTTPIWHGGNLNFFWAENWIAAPGEIAMFVTNFYATNPNGAVTGNDDPIWWLSSISGNWTALTPLTLVAGNTILTAKIIVRWHGSLILLNTIEVDSDGDTNTNFTARARWSGTDIDPTSVDAFLEIGEVGSQGGSFLDATTDEQIVSASFIKDRLIVQFERSTWELVYQGSPAQQFTWNKLNSELGSESLESVVPFDQEVLCIGSTGVHSCNGSNVARIDNLIPDKIFRIKNTNSSTARISGIRDYYNELVYWAYPSVNVNAFSTYNNKILVYNYANKTWAEFDDSITAWGYFEQEIAPTWANVNSTWEQYNASWNSGIIQAQSTQVMGGNQQGWTFLMRADTARNSPSLYITGMTLGVDRF